MVELQNVSVTYSSGVDALNNVSLKINDGDFAFVVGSSGAGKSTMIKLLLKEINATSGTVTVNGYNLNKLKKRQIPEFRRTLGFVFQDFRLINSMTVYENIAFVLRVIDAPPKYIRKRVPYVIGLVGLSSKTNSYPDELSGGEKQRVAIARALVNDPQLIIADEPTGNIDPELSYEIVELLKGINDQGTTILMVTHEHDLVRHFGGRIINITDGEIVFDEVITGLSDEMLIEEEILARKLEERLAVEAEEEEYVSEESQEEVSESSEPIKDIKSPSQLHSLTSSEEAFVDEILASITGEDDISELLGEIQDTEEPETAENSGTEENTENTETVKIEEELSVLLSRIDPDNTEKEEEAQEDNSAAGEGLSGLLEELRAEKSDTAEKDADTAGAETISEEGVE